ncbi:MAG: bifunctional hydroxymethylpyrimidine kinase/phosphomethylpyrimidine kinase [Mycoplasma sp.]
MVKVLTVAGSDCSGGAGIQADLKTIACNKCYGMSVITALTAQNTTGVKSVYDIDIQFIADQFDSVFTDIVPDAVKIGMVSNDKTIHIIVKKLKEYNAKNIVVDPVMISTSGYKLIDDNSIEILKKELIPIASLITPNIKEAELLSNMSISNHSDMEKVAIKLFSQFKVPCLVKGGHNIEDANDVLCDQSGITWFNGKRIDNKNTHGTGCTLSSAIACNLGNGNNLKKSIELAKGYLSKILNSKLDLGNGPGPLDHTFEK